MPTAFRDHLVLGYEIVKWDGDLGRPTAYQALDAALPRPRSSYSMSTIPRRYTVRGTTERLFLDWREFVVSNAGTGMPRRSMSTRSH